MVKDFVSQIRKSELDPADNGEPLKKLSSNGDFLKNAMYLKGNLHNLFYNLP